MNEFCKGDKKPVTDEWEGKAEVTDNCTVPKAGPPEAASSGWPWYAWALIIVGALAVIGGLVYAFYPSKDKKPKKKKRAVKAPEVPAPAPVAMPAPVITTSVPMPAYTYAAPTVQYAAPMQYAAPVQSVQYAAPVQSVQYRPASVSIAPATYAAPAIAAEPVTGLAAAAFNALDSNHDGVITREEFNAAMNR